jgi:hypothetical protein
MAGNKRALAVSGNLHDRHPGTFRQDIWFNDQKIVDTVDITLPGLKWVRTDKGMGT